MNPTQWVWEAESAKIAEEDRIEELKIFFDIAKTAIIQLLGLNVMPVKDENGRLRIPGESEIIPLSVWAASESLLGEALTRNQELLDQADLDAELEQGVADPSRDLSPEELDELMNDFGDIEFDEDVDLFNRLDWESDEAKTMRRQLIQVVDTPGVNRKSRITVQEITDDGEPEFNMPTNTVVESVEVPDEE